MSTTGIPAEFTARERLRNGIPLMVQTEPYTFWRHRPLRVGDETEILTVRGKIVHVILLRGEKRKRWLVKCSTLRKYLREDARQKIAAMYP